MYVDACAIIAILSDERDAKRMSGALGTAGAVTSVVAVLEASLALERPDKFNISVESAKFIVLDFLNDRGISFVDLPPAARAIELSVHAAEKHGKGKHRLNLGDFLHYACAKHLGLPVLTTDIEFGKTDLVTVT